MFLFLSKQVKYKRHLSSWRRSTKRNQNLGVHWLNPSAKNFKGYTERGCDGALDLRSALAVI
jgi:hypothetical protein